MKLFEYDHCPYCVRVRMILGLKQIKFERSILLNDDEHTPISMVGKKVVPILQKKDGSYMMESLDIVHYLDALNGSPILNQQETPLSDAIKAIDNSVFMKLVNPRHVRLDLKEFSTESARTYFINKKSKMLGDFDECLADTERLIKEITPSLTQLDAVIPLERINKQQFSIEDILLFPILRNLTVVKSLKFGDNTLNYIQKFAELTQVNLYFNQAI